MGLTLAKKRVGIVSYYPPEVKPATASSQHQRRAPPSRGRPRDATRDAAIHAAAVRLLKEVGYDRMSIGAIAAHAGVSKATIYRRWPNKAAVVASAVERQTTGTPPEPRGGALRDDLLEVLQWLALQIAEQDIAMVAAVLAGMRSDPALATAMRDRLHRDQTAIIERSLLQAAQRREPLHPHAAALVAEIAPAVIVHRLLIVGEACDPPFLEHLVDDILVPLLRPG